jgi:plastocyanin
MKWYWRIDQEDWLQVSLAIRAIEPYASCVFADCKPQARKGRRKFREEIRMCTFKRSAIVGVIFLAALLLAGLASAGDVKGKVAVQGLRSAENIAVYVNAIPGKTFDPPTQHVSIDQRQMTFIPHVTIILKGTTVDFLNSDKVAHNVYWPSVGGKKTLAHNLTIVSPGQKKSFRFDDLGAAELLCNLHPEMVGYVVVVPTPYFALTGKDGSFEIKGVPAGTYTLTTWSEDGKPTTQSVTVGSDTVNVDLTVKK